ncbi:hypothetical protein CDL15_Pgr017467 [Punica granatum]|uniref:Uncharacterized protein n=1 Tax=Punica granatum TaxID=22663 RepID=A0A218W654_PUNGR|nr:hypothetical protein CDL15_Pgr017467 [Punica granatum]
MHELQLATTPLELSAAIPISLSSSRSLFVAVLFLSLVTGHRSLDQRQIVTGLIERSVGSAPSFDPPPCLFLDGTHTALPRKKG